MKRFLSVFMAAASLAVLGGVAQAAEQPKVEKYTYKTKLDIARVISVEDPGNVCEVVPVHMVYEDHQGQRHVVEYSVMGKGCQSN
ncbi:DUF2790 domain-containing protein [Azotobacter chroococcum]|jgi:hypothetical protein|uniref:Uncharacterized protein DUF2790 n=2 Tax=Azotobacter TaxID=352 RepID=A0A4R1P836_9GAMM|nr:MULTISPECIES: DUF2790 domain-containing protein [Azotobacter]TBV95194.1 DUF2790 domain-containing protein [Azotobacter chroococcum]TCL22048.1 uncharacterized protein DUF2790 [Azotobacter chroococcum]SEI76920.1 Protein of unknown function [Azotobacter beijerinckii]